MQISDEQQTRKRDEVKLTVPSSIYFSFFIFFIISRLHIYLVLHQLQNAHLWWKTNAKKNEVNVNVSFVNILLFIFFIISRLRIYLILYQLQLVNLWWNIVKTQKKRNKDTEGRKSEALRSTYSAVLCLYSKHRSRAFSPLDNISSSWKYPSFDDDKYWSHHHHLHIYSTENYNHMNLLCSHIFFLLLNKSFRSLILKERGQPLDHVLLILIKLANLINNF